MKKLFVLWITILATQLGYAQQLTFGVQHFPPFAVVESGKPVSGVLVPTMHEILKKIPLDYKLKGYPPKRLFQGLENGTIHLGVGAKGIPGYHDHVIYGDQPYITVELRLYAREGMPTTKKLKDLVGKRLLLIRGYGYLGAIHDIRATKGIELHEVNTHKSALLMLKKERGDYLLDYKYPVETIRREVDVPNLQWKRLLKAGAFFMVSKKAPNAEALIESINKAAHGTEFPWQQ